MAKRPMTRRAKMLKRQELQEKVGHHQGHTQTQSRCRGCRARQAEGPRASSSKDKSQLGRASTSVRGKTHDLSSSGRKTMARTQGGSRKGGRPRSCVLRYARIMGFPASQAAKSVRIAICS